MTKKDYIAIAKMFATIRKHSAVYATADMQPFRPDFAVVEVATVEAELADLLARDNPRFDRERFLAACQSGRS